jgi:glycogen(starch) synthase
MLTGIALARRLGDHMVDPNPPPFVPEAGFTALLSWYEPFGMVILEGMLYGAAVAAGNVGGPAEILEHGRTGLLFAPRNPGALADATTGLATDVRLRTRLAAGAAAEVRRRWLWSAVLPRMAAVYADALRT